MAVTGLILVVLLAPGDRLPVTSLTGLDKVAHVASYVLVGLTWHRAGLPARWVLLLGAALAAGTEGAQELMAVGREGDPWDLAANAAGLALGVGASSVVERRGGGGP